MSDERRIPDPFGLGEMGRTMGKTLIDALKAATTPVEPDEDWTDPDYVLGAVLAQIEDLTPQQKCRVLADALTQAISELR